VLQLRAAIVFMAVEAVAVVDLPLALAAGQVFLGVMAVRVQQTEYQVLTG
jgi:hypothetical protein